MQCDMNYIDPPQRPSFFYHLGDVVYYAGESANYWPEFYEPYSEDDQHHSGLSPK
jgi:hypothetical protein